MTYDEFQKSLDAESPPEALSAPLAAMWCVKEGDWSRAHELVQNGSDSASAWVHAYLHRVEGDLANAAYWYRTAGQEVSEKQLEAEWEEITRQLLAAPARASTKSAR